jgi:hypothetical protein
MPFEPLICANCRARYLRPRDAPASVFDRDYHCQRCERAEFREPRPASSWWMVGWAAAGALIGAAIAGPAGALVGGAIGMMFGSER